MKNFSVDGPAQIVIGGEIESRAVTPVEGLRGIFDRQELDAIDSHRDKVMEVLENNRVEGPELDEGVLARV